MSTLDQVFWMSVFAGALRAAVPLILAGLGQIIYERSGVLNLGIEGFLLLGALSSVAAQAAGLPWAVSMAVAGCMASIATFMHASACVYMNTNQAVTGLAFLFLLQGATSLWGQKLVGIPLEGLQNLNISFASLPQLINSVNFRIDYMVPVAFITTFLLALLLKKSTYGIYLRACGENFQAARSADLRPNRLRVQAGLIAGFFYGLAGGYIALFSAQQWQENMVGGRGWIALVLVIFARWHPIRLLVIALLFSSLSAFQLNLQIAGVPTSRYLLASLPFLLTMIFLALSSYRNLKGHRSIPAELGKSNSTS